MSIHPFPGCVVAPGWAPQVVSGAYDAFTPAHRRAIADGAREHGATVHFVTQDLDAGPVIIQGRVEVLEDDSEHTLAARVHEVEHRIYPEAVRWFASGRLRVEGDVATLDGQPLT